MRRIEKRRTIDTFTMYAPSREPGLYAQMFIQDIHAGLMGFRHMREKDGRHVVVEGDEAGKAAVESICTSLTQYSRYDLGETVEEAVESVSLRLAWLGKAVYEICGSSGTELSLASVVPHRLFRIPGGFVQFVPKKDRRWTNGRRYAFLPRRYAWVVCLPWQLGSSRKHRRVLNQLTAVSLPAPDFWTRELQAGKFATEFVVSDYNRNRDAYISRLTRRWGWNRRDSSGTYTTEFFYFFRSLRFRQAQAMLRDHIVSEMNKLLNRLQLDARIRLEGFHSPTKIDELMRQASAGTLHYAEALRDAR